MSAPRSRISIGVMARAPTPGRCKTRLAPALGSVGAAVLYRAMLLDTLEALDRIPDVRKFLLAAPEDDGVAALQDIAPAGWCVVAQRGADLGERLAHAFEGLADHGGPVVLVSSDSPMMPIQGFAPAFARWGGDRRALIGPCEDGGYYLIGLTAPAPGVLSGISWSTSLVLSQTRARMKELGIGWEELPVSYDVDTPSDLVRLRADLALRPDVARRCSEGLGVRS
jgi:rSAM/selenodomain-associated transferase 1